MELIELNAVQILDLLKKNEITSQEYVEALLTHIDNREPLVGAWTYLNKDLMEAVRVSKEQDPSNHQLVWAIFY